MGHASKQPGPAKVAKWVGAWRDPNLVRLIKLCSLPFSSVSEESTCAFNKLESCHSNIHQHNDGDSTHRRGVDKNVVCLLRDRTEGNTMVKVWRQIQENHTELYFKRKDLYTTHTS